jgi:large subunit ribosomal protein L1
MARLSVSQAFMRPTVSSLPRFVAPALVQSRQASVIRSKKTTKKKPIPKDFKRHNLTKREFPQYSLCEAMRYAQLFYSTEYF